eukprot:COSAG01_NODE_2208_length_8166_cov_2.677823_5_plen_185_part_00
MSRPARVTKVTVATPEQVSEAMVAFSQDGCRGIVLGYTSQLRATGQFVLSRWRRQLACTLDYDATILRPAGRTQPAGRRSSKEGACAGDELVCEPLLMGRGSIHDLQTALIDAVAVAAVTAHATAAAQAAGAPSPSSRSKLRGVREHRGARAAAGAAAGAGLGSPPPPPPAGWCSWYELGTHVR